jgi:uncharacterized membrane protein YkvA (DUF1232 family)
MKILDRWKGKARQLALEIASLYYAYKHPKTPWYAKAWCIVVVSYAVSPIDLIPDFIPVVGYLDDLVLIPLGIMVAIRLIPKEVYAESKQRARQRLEQAPAGRLLVSALVVAAWGVTIALIVGWIVRKLRR